MGKTIRNLEIDRLRALAVGLVIWTHIPPYLYQDESVWPKPISRTWTGVELFFVISGFVVSSNLLPHLKTYKWKAIGRFYLRRIFRLFPVCWLWIGISVLSSIFFNSSGSFYSLEQFKRELFPIFAYYYNYFVVFDIGKLGWHWSLSVEEQFYLAYPVFLRLFLTRSGRTWVSIAVICGIAFGIVPWAVKELGADANIEEPHLRFLSQYCFDRIFGGCLLYFLSTKPWYSKLIPRRFLNRFYGFWISTIAASALAISPWLFYAEPILGHIVISGTGMILVYLASLNKGLVFESSWDHLNSLLNWLGRRSYTLYLNHVPCFWMTREISVRFGIQMSFTQMTVISLGIIAVTAELSYRFVEKPMIDLSHSW